MKPKASFPVFLVLEGHVEVGGRPEHVQERPQCKALAPVVLKAEIDPAMLNAGCKGIGRNPGEVGGGKVALQQIVKLHDRSIVGSAPNAHPGISDLDDEGPSRPRRGAQEAATIDHGDPARLGVDH